MNATKNNTQEPNPFEQSFSSIASKKFSKHFSPNYPPYQQHMPAGNKNNNVDIWVSDTSTYTFDSNSINNDSYSSDHQASSNSTSEASSSNSDDIFLNNNSIMYDFKQQRPNKHNSNISYNDPQHAVQQQYQTQHINNTSQNTKNGAKKQPTVKQTKKRTRTVKLPEDEEKRKNFLERNRLAALKCRQRKKQWLSNLQIRVDYLTNDNEQLQMESEALHKEIMDLKTLLLAHRDCPQYNAAAAAEALSMLYHHHHHRHQIHQEQPFYHQPSDFSSNTVASIL